MVRQCILFSKKWEMAGVNEPLDGSYSSHQSALGQPVTVDLVWWNGEVCSQQSLTGSGTAPGRPRAARLTKIVPFC